MQSSDSNSNSKFNAPGANETPSAPCPWNLPRRQAFWILCLRWLCCLGLGIWNFPAAAAPREPVRLHSDNPHYFLWRGKPTLLITSGEHYGAVLNLDFDYKKYLDTLAKDKLNLTRTFAGGAYVEPQGAFNIARNTLAPAANRYITPWARSDVPDYAGGGNKFDLSRWNEDYFKRLRDFVRYASKRGVVVEMNLFCPMYEEAQWKLSPFNAANNINGLGNIARTNVYTLDQHGGLLAVEERMTRRIVEELREFDNVYYEICNEPYFGGVTIAWQHHIAGVITDVQKKLHPPGYAGGYQLISQNIANNQAVVLNPHPAVSIFNFHYAAPPDTVAMNYHLNKVIGDNETGFRGTNDAPYRMEGWDFLIAGGALFNNLDYSFTIGHEDGTFVYPASQPGGGNPTFRRQLRVLRDFLYGFDFVRMKPDNSVIKNGLPPNLAAHALVQRGKQYAIYLHPSKWPSKPPFPKQDGTVVFGVELPAGTYQAEWLDPKLGTVEKKEKIKHDGGVRQMAAPSFSEDIALRIRR